LFIPHQKNGKILFKSVNHRFRHYCTVKVVS
jgi:hypothetical protein